MGRRRAAGAILTSVLVGVLAPIGGVAAKPSRAPTPHLDRVETELRTLAPGLEGTVWGRSEGNHVAAGRSDGNWILQTPDCWGQPACENPLGFTRWLDALRNDLSTARRIVDVTTLDPFPDGQFRQALVDGLKATYAAGRNPLVRINAGSAPFYDLLNHNAWKWRDALAHDLGPYAARARIVVARSRTWFFGSFNHAKIIAVDGRSLVTGGHNMWESAYLQTDNPVHDLSLRLTGPAALAAHRFADLEWGRICTTLWEFWMVEYAPFTSAAAGGCPTHQAPESAKKTGRVPVLSVGRLGIGLDVPGTGGPTEAVPPAPEEGECWNLPNPINTDLGYLLRNPAETALRALVRSARRSVFLSQQDMLGMCPLMGRADLRLLDDLARQMLAGVDVTVVTSTPGASWGIVNMYSNVSSLQETSQALLARLTRVVGDPGEAQTVLCARLRLASIRFGATAQWPNGIKIANHAKAVAVDGEAFYIGSQNLYPAYHQEWGVMIENPAAVAAFSTHYLDPLWQWSRATATVDPGQSRCNP